MQEGGEKEGSEGKPDATGSGEGQGYGEGSGDSGDKKGEGKGKADGKGQENGEEGLEGETGTSGPEDGEGQRKRQRRGSGKRGRRKICRKRSTKESYQIYKEQQRIRQELEFQLENMINDADRSLGERIAREMEMFENDLLQNGITQKTADRLNRIQQQLMRLENAALKQGLDDKTGRAVTRKNEFTSPVLTPPEIFGRKQREIEFLNREALPYPPPISRSGKEVFH